MENGLDHFGSPLARKSGQLQETAFAFHQRGESDRALPGDQGIAFPMTEQATGRYRGGSGFDADPIGNLGLTHLSSQTSLLSFAVSTPQEEDQLLSVRRLGVVDVLVDRLVADGESGMVETDPSRDDLRSPALVKFGPDVGPKAVAFEPGALAGLLPAGSGSVLSPVREVAVVDQRGVSTHLPGDGAGCSSQRLSDLTK